jgi:hypothetical protein
MDVVLLQECAGCELEFGSEFSKHHCRGRFPRVQILLEQHPKFNLLSLACGNVFCDTCSNHRHVVPWVDPSTAVRVCKQCHEKPRSSPPTPVVISAENQRSRPRPTNYESTSNGQSTSTASSGEHLRDLFLSPTDLFDIEQLGSGTQRVRFLLQLCVHMRASRL